MNSKIVWVGVSISILTAIAQAQQVAILPEPDQDSTATEMQIDSTPYFVRPENDGGVTVISVDGSQVYFSKEQIAIINRAKGKDAAELKNGAFCARIEK